MDLKREFKFEIIFEKFPIEISKKLPKKTNRVCVLVVEFFEHLFIKNE
jgi:hypothetical protein